MENALDMVLEILQMVVDALFFLFALGFVFNLISSGTFFSTIVQEKIGSNETVVTAYIDADYSGYIIDGIERYDGVISGTQVYSDILNSDIENITLQINGSMVDLTTKAYADTTYLDYVRNSNPALLKNDISFGVDYIRKYMTDENGKIMSVVYEKKF